MSEITYDLSSYATSRLKRWIRNSRYIMRGEGEDARLVRGAWYSVDGSVFITAGNIAQELDRRARHNPGKIEARKQRQKAAASGSRSGHKRDFHNHTNRVAIHH